MNYIVLFSALSLSTIAAYYSVLGLTAIFVGSFWPIAIMGSTLEFAKVVTVSWLYRNWTTTPIIMRLYLLVAIVLLMIITSMGIFGFLSKSHIVSSVDSNDNAVQLQNLKDQEKAIQSRLDYLLARAKDPSTASIKLDNQIQNTQKDLRKIVNQELPLLQQNNKFTAEFGPLKYIAQMIYHTDDIDQAVRLVIMIIMVVFDPLAMLLLISANMNIPIKTEQSNQEINQESDTYTSEKRTIHHAPGIYSEEVIVKKE